MVFQNYSCWIKDSLFSSKVESKVHNAGVAEDERPLAARWNAAEGEEGQLEVLSWQTGWNESEGCKELDSKEKNVLSPHFISKLSVIDSLWKISCWLQLFTSQELENELQCFRYVRAHLHNKEDSVNKPKLVHSPIM